MITDHLNKNGSATRSLWTLNIGLNRLNLRLIVPTSSKTKMHNSRKIFDILRRCSTVWKLRTIEENYRVFLQPKLLRNWGFNPKIYMHICKLNEGVKEKILIVPENRWWDGPSFWTKKEPINQFHEINWVTSMHNLLK